MWSQIIIALTLFAKTLALCNESDTIDISNGTFLPDGAVYHGGALYKKPHYFSTSGGLRGCVCDVKVCVRKCCDFGLAYHIGYKQCVNVTELFDVPVYNHYRKKQDVNATQMFHFVTGKVNCSLPELRVRAKSAAKSFELRTDGSLYVELPGSIPPWMIRPPDKYCIDTMVMEEADGTKTSTLDALVCFAEKPNKSFVLSSSCMLVSCVFLLATVAVYICLPELHNLHGRVLVAYLLCLFCGFAFLATMQLLLTVGTITVNGCVSMTIVIYFFLESAFFWLNVMCFDIYWTFSGKRGLALEKMSIRARFAAYAAYAFGIPSALTALVAGLEFSGLAEHPLLPRLRSQACFIDGNSKLLYLYGPMMILCLANVGFFVLTAVRIAQIKRQTSVLKSKESAMHDPHRKDKQRFWLYIKLFCVMGINWILEIISALYPEAQNFFQITDAYNVLIGLVIFIIFVCKRKIFRLMKKRYHQWRGDPMSRTQTTMSSRTVSMTTDIHMNSVKSVTKNY